MELQRTERDQAVQVVIWESLQVTMTVFTH